MWVQFAGKSSCLNSIIVFVLFKIEVDNALKVNYIQVKSLLAPEHVLILMNSFVTHEDSLAKLDRHPELGSALERGFLQHKEPKIDISDCSPVSWPDNPSLEWCPPGHGDIYVAMVTSGVLSRLLSQGYRYVFVSNADTYTWAFAVVAKSQ